MLSKTYFIHFSASALCFRDFPILISIALYTQYFTGAAHPSSYVTLLKAALDGGIPQPDAEAFISDEMEGLAETRMLIREQASNGVDSVPYIMIEGKRRDFSLEGAKEVPEYLKILENVVKEAQ